MSDNIELRDVEGNVFAVVKPAAWPVLQDYLDSVQAEYDRVLGPGAVQVVADSESPVEDAVNGDARSND